MERRKDGGRGWKRWWKRHDEREIQQRRRRRKRRWDSERDVREVDI